MKQLREYCYSPLDGILVQHRVIPSSMSPVPIYTPGWRETLCSKASCPKKQHEGRDWASNYCPSDLKSNTLTTTPPRPYRPLLTYFYIILALSLLAPLKDPSQARLCYCFDPQFAIKLLVERDKTSTVQLVKL